MGFIITIISFICIMCILIIKGSFLSITLSLVTKKRLDLLYLFLPSLISIIIHILLIYFTNKLLVQFDVNVVSNLVNNLLNITYSFKALLIASTAYFLEETLYIILQAFVLKLAIFNWVWNIKKICLNISKKEPSKELDIYNSSDDLSTLKLEMTYFNRFIVSLLSNALSFLITILLLYIGAVIGIRVLPML